MKKNLLCLTLAASLVLSANPALPAFADGEEPSVFSVSAEDTLPDKRALPLSLLLPAEDAKSAKIERTTFDFTDAVSVRRYTGEGASASIPENNVYGITSSVPTLYTGVYRYCEVVYYYDTADFSAEGKHFGFTLGFTQDADTKTKTPWSNATIYAEDELCANKWTSAVFDLSTLASLSPTAFTDNTVYEHIRLRPFGDLTASALSENDVLYIKKVVFSKDDPRALAETRTVRYYDSAVKAALGGDDYLFRDEWTVGDYETTRSFVKEDGKPLRSWRSTKNTLYKADRRLFCEHELTEDLFLYPDAAGETVCYVVVGDPPAGLSADLIHTSFSTAFYAIGDEGGTIYVSGTAEFPNNVDPSAGHVTIRGLNGTSDRILMNTSGSLVARDITFENITLKSQNADERWIESAAHITFGESCVIEKSEPYGNNNVITGLYIGRNDEYLYDGKLTLSSPTGVYTMIAPIGQYSAGGGYTVTGNFECEINAGTVVTAFGAVRNGCQASSYQTVDGDVFYRINGGNIKSLFTGSVLGGNVNGNVLFELYGGTYDANSKLVFGNSSNYYAAKSSANNIAVIADGKSLSENATGSASLTITSQADFSSLAKNSAVLILNHAEYAQALPNVTASSLTGKYRVTGGTARPVYAPQKFGGALLGYEIVGDDPHLSPYIGSTLLHRNEYGVYTLPTGDSFYDITFDNALAGTFFSVYFDPNNGAGEMTSQSVEGNVGFTLPACGATNEGYVFGGWSRDGEIYRAGDTAYTDKECVFRAVWLDESEVFAVYVSDTVGDDTLAGIGYGAPVKTFEKALERAASYGVSRIILTDLVSTSLANLTFNGPLVVTAKDGSTQYDGGLINLVPLNIKTPVTFEYMAMGSKANSFVNTTDKEVVFGKGLTKAAGTGGVYAHFGSEYATSASVNVTVESPVFHSMYLGGAYRKTPSVGVSGDVFFTVGCDIPNLTVGFDGYTGNNSDGEIAGNLVLKMRNGTIGAISTTRLSSIGGAVYVIGTKSSVFPDESILPASQGGKYFLRVDGGEVKPARASDGSMIAGTITALGKNGENRVRVLAENGTETVYSAGNIALAPGSYTFEFFESEKITSPAFEVAAPYIGMRAEEKSFSASSYTAVARWYDGAKQAERFLAGTDYTLKLTLTPRSYADTTDFSSVTLNGVETVPTQNDDGSFTATLAFPAESGTLKTSYVRYVSQNGDDNAAGTEAAPYKTLNKALTVLSAVGGTVFIRGTVDAGGTYPNKKPVFITGYGDSTAELTLAQYSGILVSADTTFDDLLFTAGASSHFNNREHLLTFGKGLSLEGHMIHAGAYSSRNNYRSVPQSHTVIDGSTSIGTLHAGGGYVTNRADGVEGDLSIEIGKDAIVRAMNIGADHYLNNHTGVSLGGSLLVTVNGGTLRSVNASTCPIYPSESTTYQFIFNYGAAAPNTISEAAAPRDKRYTVFSGLGGRVDHALDENGKAIPGMFDVNPDPDHYALIRYGTYRIFSRGGRFRLPARTDVEISYVRSEYPLAEYALNLNGGTASYGMVSVDAQGRVHFGAAPQKDGYAFEGWYRDEAFTELVCDGDLIGESCVLYAKYYAFSRAVDDRQFAVAGVQMRLPLESGVTQGLRFVMEISLSSLADIFGFSEKNGGYVMEASVTAEGDFASSDQKHAGWMMSHSENSETGYGATVLPTDKLAGRELLCDTDYVYRGKTYRSKTVPALRLFGQEGDVQRYTLCVTGITEDKYEYGYTVRPYLNYYSRSGNLVTLYGDEYSSNVYKTAVAALESGEESARAEEYLRTRICGVIAEKNGIEFIPQNILNEVNVKTAQYKQNVLNSENISTDGFSNVYYVSADGNDANDGKTPETAWQTINKVRNTSLSSGDAVLFRRGDMFRGKITGQRGVTYSAYGSGAKPIINGSAQNYADPALWQETGIENVYLLTERLANVGIIAFDHTVTDIGNYDETVGGRRVSGVNYYGKTFFNQNHLNGDLQFYSDLNTNALYLYSAHGNPGSRFSSIEIGTQSNLFSPATGNHVDNLHFLYGGSHGVGAGGGFAKYDANGNYIGITGTSDLTVTNCVFAWIGGSILKGFSGGNTTGYGNAIEIYGSVDGYRVENNWIYQIYDTAITHQTSSTSCGDTMMQNILYKKNLCEYCHWSIEFYNAPCKGTHSRITRNVLVEENIIRMGGYGWGSEFRRTGATLYNSFGLSNVPEETSNFLAKNNIFFRSQGPIFRLNSNASERNLTFDGNLYIQDYGKQLAYYCGSIYYYKNEAESLISAESEGSIIGETNCAGVYYYLP